jgi:uncharacterized membrane protein (Fun14 family)
MLPPIGVSHLAVANLAPKSAVTAFFVLLLTVRILVAFGVVKINTLTFVALVTSTRLMDEP